MTVTIALMGFGISGTLVSVFAKRIKDPEAMAAYAILGLAVSSFASLRGASNVPSLIPYGPLQVKLTLSYLVLVLPFLCGGTALGLLFMRHAENIFRLYGADLMASAAAVLLFSFLLRPFGADGFIWLCTGLALLAFIIEARRTKMRKSITLMGASVCALGFFTFGTDLVNDQPEFYKTSGKVYRDDLTTERLEKTEWTTITKIDVFSDTARDLVSGKFRPDAGRRKMITQDSDAYTIMPGKEMIENWFIAARSGRLVGSPSLVYRLRPEPSNTLVIGVGGGIDIAIARAFGARRIEGVELNPATVELMMGPYADYALWPKWEDVEIHRAEGRHFVRNTEQRYDTVVMSGIDTFSALSSGAYVLAENYLYTVEAMKDYIDALKDDGVMVIFRWLFSQPRESLRLANLFLEASDQMGIEDPSASIVVVSDDFGWEWRWASTLIKKKPFTPEEVRMIVEQVARVPNLAMVYIPNVFEPGEQQAIERRAFREDTYLQPTREAYRELLTTEPGAERAAFETNYQYRIDPVTDDRPFFFEYDKGGTLENGLQALYRIRGTGALYSLHILFITSAVLSCLAMLLPLWRFERDGLKINGAGSLVGFFSSLGIGFMLIEIGLMQWLNLYLGDPMFSLMVVLAGILLFTGFGSLLAVRFRGGFHTRLKIGMLGVTAIVPVWLFTMSGVLPWTENWPFAMRIAVALISLLPLGLLMGIPFATGLRYIADSRKQFVPWAWGINGLTSVMASILAVILAMRIGFTAVLILGACTYLLGFIAIHCHLKRPA